MNIDKNKLFKMAATLAVIFVVVGSLTKIAEKNSMTLSEYAKKHDIPMNAPEESKDIESEADSADNTSNENAAESDSTASHDSPSENSSATSASSPLIGAALNGDSQTDARTTYKEGFYYEPLSDNLRRYITGVSYPKYDSDDNTSAPAITYDELRYLHILYYDFDKNLAEGELICNALLADDLAEIFYELHQNEYQLEKVRLIDEYDGDDNSSMMDNNTSCFNYRVVEGSTHLSKHALGLAVDINPLYNPYIRYKKDGTAIITPENAADYTDRSLHFPYKIDENDFAYKLFKEHGFTWGGDWNSCKDYQHFQKIP